MVTPMTDRYQVGVTHAALSKVIHNTAWVEDLAMVGGQ